MARKNEYGLPDETLQLIAGSPDIFADGRYLQQRPSTNSRLAPSSLINALRASGTGNAGLTQYANPPSHESATARTVRRSLFNPARLTMSRTNRDVTLPGAETQTRPPRVVEPIVLGPRIIDDNVEDDDVIVEDVDDGVTLDDDVMPVGTVITDDGVDDDVVVLDTVVGGTGNDTVVGGTGGNGTGGTGGSGTAGTGGTGTGGLGGTGTTGTGVTTAGTGTTGGTGDLRDAIVAAMGGSGSIDNSAAGVEGAAGSLSAATSLSGDQIASLTKPKVASVTLESSGPALDQDTGATSMTFDYPELLSPDELKAYEAWMATQGGGGAGVGKPAIDETLGMLEF